MNPFWRVERVMRSSLAPDECKLRLKKAPTSLGRIARLWFGRGDAAFYRPGAGRLGSLLEMHVRVDVGPPADAGCDLSLRFSWGAASSVLLTAIIVAGVVVFGWTVSRIAGGHSWDPIYGAGLLAIAVPVLLMAALGSEAPGAVDDLWEFVAEQVGARD